MPGARRRVVVALALALLPAAAAAQPAPFTATEIVTTAPSSAGICVGCPVPTLLPAANSGARLATITIVPLGVPAETSNKLYSIAGELTWNGATVATGASVIGTAGTIGLFTGPAAMGDSVMTQTGSSIRTAGPFTAEGILTITGLGGHTFTAAGAGENAIHVRNTATTPTSEAALGLGNNVAPDRLRIEQFSSTFTETGRYRADGGLIDATGVGGLTLAASNAGSPIRFVASGLAEVAFLNGVAFQPTVAGAVNLGNTGQWWGAAFANALLVKTTGATNFAAITAGAGAPVLPCQPGSVWLRSDGGPTTSMYVCAGLPGPAWVAK